VFTLDRRDSAPKSHLPGEAPLPASPGGGGTPMPAVPRSAAGNE